MSPALSFTRLLLPGVYRQGLKQGKELLLFADDRASPPQHVLPRICPGCLGVEENKDVPRNLAVAKSRSTLDPASPMSDLPGRTFAHLAD